MEALIEPWHIVRSIWEEHARFLFRDFCRVFRVLQEAVFANDEGIVASDTILVEVSKSSASDCMRRSLRLFQKVDNDSSTTHNSKEPVCEIINRKKFIECVQMLVPTMPTKEVRGAFLRACVQSLSLSFLSNQIEEMFDEALDIAHDSVLRTLGQLWLRFLDQSSNYTSHLTGIPTSPATDEEVAEAIPYEILGKTSNHRNMGTNRAFWVNQRTLMSQWTKPYSPRVFRSNDIEMDVFVQILIRRDIFPKRLCFALCFGAFLSDLFLFFYSPFIKVLSVPPKDLWPNADMFLKQIRERSRKTRQEKR